MCQGGRIREITVDEQEYGDEDGSAREHCNPRICLGLSVQSRMPLYKKIRVKAPVDNIPS